MRARTLTIAAAVVLLAGCSTTETTAEQSPVPTVETTTVEATTPPVVVETTTAPDPAELVEQCDIKDPQGPIGEALMTADLPDGTRISSVDEFPPLPDAEDQDSTVVQVTLCSVPLNRDEHRTVATSLAVAAGSAEGPGIYRMDVTLEVPREDGSLQEGRHLFVEDFQSIVWERDNPEETFNFWREV